MRPHDEPFTPERSPFLWLVEREILRFLNIWQYAIVGPVLSTVLFVVVFGSALGRHVDPIDGVAYGQFIVGGLFARRSCPSDSSTARRVCSRPGTTSTSTMCSPVRCDGGRSTRPS